jgi:extradiol dioxygenase family protein
MASSRWFSIVLQVAGVYNLAWGLLAVLAPDAAWRWMGLPLPNYPELWQCIGMIVGVYGIGYWIAASNPVRHWPIVLVGLLGKVFGPIGFLQAAASGRFPWSFGWTILTNDLIWWVPFGMILYHAWRSERESSRNPASRPVSDANLPVIGQAVIGQPVRVQPVSGQRVNGQPVNVQSVSGEPVSGEPLSDQRVSSEPLSGPADRAGLLDSLDHVAIPVADVAAAVDWYRQRFRCTVSYQDSTWALLQLENTRLAFVIPEQHPPHVAFTHPNADQFGGLKTHRDGTRSCYISDPSGNPVEIMAI